MSLQQLVTTALRKSPLARELTNQVTRDLDAKRAAAHRALEAAKTEGTREVRATLDAEAAATAQLEAAVRAQQAALVQMSEAWQRRTSTALIAYEREGRLARDLEALAAPEIARFLKWADEVAAAIMVAPLPQQAGGDVGRRHPWIIGGREDDDAWGREQTLLARILDRLRSAREEAEGMKISGAPQAQTAKALAGMVRKLRGEAREISALRPSKLMEGDPLAEPEPTA
jgi:hypothetical protein